MLWLLLLLPRLTPQPPWQFLLLRKLMLRTH
jgi:hypothetical protein